MTETVFEGMVNNVKYNDQTEWNKAIEECIKSGKSYTASSAIQTVNKTDGNDNSSSPEDTVRCDNTSNTKDLFPLFNSTSTGLEQYLDAITGSAENMESAVKSMDLYFDHCRDVVSKKITEEEDQDWLYHYMNELDDISNSITDYDRANEAARAELCDRKKFLERKLEVFQKKIKNTKDGIDTLSGKLDKLETVKEELKKIRKFYEDAFKKAYIKNHELINKYPDHTCSEENKLAGDHNNESINKDESEDEFRESKDALHKLIEEIFGKDWDSWGAF